MRESPHWDKDFVIAYGGKQIAYLSAKYNVGNFTDYRAIGGRTDLTGTEAIYPHLLLGLLDDGEWSWNSGELKDFQIQQARGDFIEWTQSYLDPAGRFESSSHHKMFVRDRQLIQRVDTTLTALADIPNVVDLWVEISWQPDLYDTAVTKDANGNVEERSLLGRPGEYYFTQNPGRWVVAHGPETDAAIAMKFISARQTLPNGTTQDIFGYTNAYNSAANDTIDGIGVQLIDAPWDSPQVIPKGTRFALSYEIVTSRPSEKGHSWLE